MLWTVGMGAWCQDNGRTDPIMAELSVFTFRYGLITNVTNLCLSCILLVLLWMGSRGHFSQIYQLDDHILMSQIVMTVMYLLNTVFSLVSWKVTSSFVCRIVLTLKTLSYAHANSFLYVFLYHRAQTVNFARKRRLLVHGATWVKKFFPSAASGAMLARSDSYLL